jgi:hypothetical protein
VKYTSIDSIHSSNLEAVPSKNKGSGTRWTLPVSGIGGGGGVDGGVVMMFWVRQLLGRVSFRTERVSVNDYAELSGDPLLVQFVRSPTLFHLVGVHAGELFEKSGIGESSERSVEAMGGPLFSMMNGLGATTILSDGEVVEMMRMITEV